MLLIVVSWSMLQYKYAFRSQHILFEHQHRYIINVLQRIRRSCKNEVVLLGTLFHKFKDIAFNYVKLIRNAQLLYRFLYKIDIAHITLYQHYLCRPAGYKLVADAARTAKYVAGFYALKIYQIAQRVEQAFVL